MVLWSIIGWWLIASIVKLKANITLNSYITQLIWFYNLTSLGTNDYGSGAKIRPLLEIDDSTSDETSKVLNIY